MRYTLQLQKLVRHPLGSMRCLSEPVAEPVLSMNPKRPEEGLWICRVMLSKVTMVMCRCISPMYQAARVMDFVPLGHPYDGHHGHRVV